MMMDQKNFYMLMRGPLLLAIISLTAVLPLIVQFVQSIISLDSNALLWLMFAASCCLIMHDMTKLIKIQTPIMIQQFLNRFILDDILRSLFDPQHGLWAVLLGCSIGNAAMYTLPCSVEERVEILQSNLECPPDQARLILQEPGGIRFLLPESFQQWLQQAKPTNEEMEHDDESHENDVTATEYSSAATTSATSPSLVKSDEEAAALAACAAARIHMAAAEDSADHELKWTLSSAAASPLLPAQSLVEANSCNSSLDDHSLTHDATTTNTRVAASRSVPRRIQATNAKMNKRDVLLQNHQRKQQHYEVPLQTGRRRAANNNNNTNSNKSDATSPPLSPAPPRLPHDILGSIVMDMMRKSIQEHVPVHRVLETTCVLAAILLVMQHSRGARRICWRMLKVSTTASLSAMLMGSVAALVSQQRTRVPTSSPTTRGVGNSGTVAEVSWLGKVNAIVRSCINEAQQRRRKGLIAMLVLFYFGKQRQRQREGPQGRRNKY